MKNILDSYFKRTLLFSGFALILGILWIAMFLGGSSSIVLFPLSVILVILRVLNFNCSGYMICTSNIFYPFLLSAIIWGPLLYGLFFSAVYSVLKSKSRKERLFSALYAVFFIALFIWGSISISSVV